MNDKYSKYVGSWIKIQSTKISCQGEIVEISDELITLENCIINKQKAQTKFVVIDTDLIQSIEFLDENLENNICSINTETPETVSVNVYSSNVQPPNIKKGGSSSAVSRNLGASPSSPNQNYFDGKSRSKSFAEFQSRSRHDSDKNGHYEPLWMNYEYKKDFDFDSNLALFDKRAFCSKKKQNKVRSDNSDSSDNNSWNNKSYLSGKGRRNKSLNIDFNDFIKLETINKVENDVGSVKKNILEEFKEIGIIPELCKVANFVQQPDIVQEATKSQKLKNQDMSNSILAIRNPSEQFEYFPKFWRLSDHKRTVPVFSVQQKELLLHNFEMSGYSRHSIIDNVGRTLTDFIISQVNLNIGKSRTIPKIALLLNRSKPAIFVAAIGRHLIERGCNILVYCHDNYILSTDKLLVEELNSLRKTLRGRMEYNGLNLITHQFEDLQQKTFDYAVTGLEDGTFFYMPESELIQWTLNQKINSGHILAIDPPQTSQLSWHSAVFIGVPTCAYDSLQVRSCLSISQYLVPRKDGIPGIELDRLYKKPDGCIYLCNGFIPDIIYSFLNLQYVSPFDNHKNSTKIADMIQLHHPTFDLCMVE